MSIQISTLKLSVQRGLLGNVSSKLRAVCAGIEENTIYVHFYYDGEISKADLELYEHAIAQIESDFAYPETGDLIEPECIMEITRLDYPQKIPLHGYWIFYRYEDSSLYT